MFYYSMNKIEERGDWNVIMLAIENKIENKIEGCPLFKSFEVYLTT